MNEIEKELNDIEKELNDIDILLEKTKHDSGIIESILKYRKVTLICAGLFLIITIIRFFFNVPCMPIFFVGLLLTSIIVYNSVFLIFLTWKLNDPYGFWKKKSSAIIDIAIAAIYLFLFVLD